MGVQDAFNDTEMGSLIFNKSFSGCALHEILVDDEGQPIDYIFLKVNSAFEELTGLRASEIIGRRVTEVLPGIEHDPFISIYGQVALTGEPTHFEQFSTPLGKYYDIAAFSPRRGLFVTTFIDATERKRAEAKIESQYSVLECIIESADSPIFSVDKNYCYTSFNRSHAAVMKAIYDVDIELGKSILEYQTVDEDRIKAKSNFDRALQGEHFTEEAYSGEDSVSRLYFEVSHNPIRDTKGRVIGVAVHARDITERKQMEDERHKVNLMLRAMTDCNQLLIRITDEENLLREICKIIVEVCGYRMAWVGYAENDEHKTIRPIAQAGYEDGDFELISPTWANEQDPIALAIKTGKPSIVNNILSNFPTDPVLAPWRDEVIKYGYNSVASLPLTINGQVFGVLNICAVDADAFDEEQFNLLNELADELSYGIASLRARIKQKQAEEDVRRQNAILNGINDIFEEALLCKNEEEIAKICLSVVEELTGSKFGFIAEVNENGRMDTVVFSDPGWDACRIQESEATLMIKGMEIRGIYGKVIQDGLPMIFNEPVSHPDWRGLPEGYPQLNCFMGVPLKSADRTIGMIGLANKESGYEPADQYAAEQLSVAFVESLNHKRVVIAHQRSEERYRSMVENLNDIIFTVDTEGHITYISPVVSIFGYMPDELVGKRFSQFTVLEDLPELMSSFEDTLKGKQGPYEFRILSKDGKVSYVRSSSLPIMENGQVTGITGRLTDITQQRELEEQFRQAQKMEVVGQLAGGVAHDFNNLLQVISGYSEVVLSQVSDSDSITYIKEILEASERATSLTRQLLAFSRRQMVQFQVIFINDIINNISKMLKRLIGEDVEFTIALSSDIMQVQADPGQIEQVIMNLAVNARDAMPEGGKLVIKTENVTIDENQSRLIPESLPGDYVFISVSDTGVGMSRETIQHIFEPFFSTKGTKGTGLGLSVVFGVVKQHDGWINVYSEPGQGSVFKIYLPIVITEKPEADTRTELSITSPVSSGGRILLVEDETQVRKFIARVLQEHGYVVFEVPNIKEATEVFEREGENIHLIFSDVVLPDGTGIELVEKLRSINPNIHVLLSSGYTDQKSQWQDIQNRKYPFIHKPYKISDLLKTIKEAMKSDSKNQET